MSESSVNPTKKTSKTFYFFIVVLVMLAAAVWWWQSSSNSTPTGPRMGGSFMGAVPVNAQQVHADRFVVQLKALGTVTPWNAVSVTSQVGGELDQLLFEEGQFVAKGTVLAQIDPRNYQAACYKPKVLCKKPGLTGQCRVGSKRYQGLYKEDSVARQTEQQQALARNCKDFKVRQAQRDNAALDVEHTRIVAPISGRLGLRALDAGNYVSAVTTELVTITQDNPIAVSFTIPEHELQAVLQAHRQAQSMPVEVWNRDESQLLAEGVLDSVDNQVDVSTGSVRLKARFDNPEQRLFPNQFVNVRLQVKEHQQALLLPADAIQFGNNGRFVWRILDDDTVEIQPIEIASSDGTVSMLQSGLNPGDWVVVEGVDRLRSGSKIERVAPVGEKPSATQESAKQLQQPGQNAGQAAGQKSTP